MSKPYVFVVGQPNTTSNIVDTIHQLGYSAGIFVDKQRASKDLTRYDQVVDLDFSRLDDEIIRIDSLNLNVAGLLCTYENYIVAKARLGEHFGVPTISTESAQLSTDKALMRQAFAKADHTVSPDFSKVDSLEQALEFARSRSYPFIIKPTNLVKSLLVLKCENEQQLRENFTYASNTIGKLYEKYNIYERKPQLIIEEFIVGRQYSIAAFVDHDGRPHFCEGIVELKNAQDIGVDDNYLYSRKLPVELPEEISTEMYKVAEKGIRALKMTSTAAHVELISGPSGVKIVEIGARIGGYRPRMYNFSYNIDLSKQELNLALGKRPQLQGQFSKYCAVYELFPEAEGTFSHISGDFDPNHFTYYRITAKKDSLVGPAKNGFKATAIIIVAAEKEDRFRELCLQAESAKVEVRP